MKKLLISVATAHVLMISSAQLSQGALRSADTGTDFDLNLICSNIPSAADAAYITNLKAAMGDTATADTLIKMLNDMSAVLSTTTPSKSVTLPSSWYTLPAPTTKRLIVSNAVAPAGNADYTSYEAQSFAIEPFYNAGTSTSGTQLSSTISNIAGLSNFLATLNAWVFNSNPNSVQTGRWIDLQQSGKVCTFTLIDPLATDPTKASKINFYLLLKASTI
jgi:hypothetical protein